MGPDPFAPWYRTVDVSGGLYRQQKAIGAMCRAELAEGLARLTKSDRDNLRLDELGTAWEETAPA